MSIAGRLRDELVAVVGTTAYFAACFGVLLLLKELVLAEYDIRFRRLSMALLGALVLAKVVLVLEHVPLRPARGQPPAWLDVLARTALYGCGAVAVLLLEKAFETRHEYGGFGKAVAGVTGHVDINHVWAAGIAVVVSLLGFNVLSILRRHLGMRGLVQIFMTPVPEKPSHRGPVARRPGGSPAPTAGA
jgi:hypothetical protein